MRRILLCAAIWLSTIAASTSLQAASFGVDSWTLGRAGTAVNALKSPTRVYYSPLNGTNFLDPISNSLIDRFGNPLPLVPPPDLLDFSNGKSPMDAAHTWDLAFSVDATSVGALGSSVNFRATNGHAVGADIFFSNPTLIPIQSNRWLVGNTNFGLLDKANLAENIDGMQLWQPPTEVDYPGFIPSGDTIYYALDNTPDLLFANTLMVGVFKQGVLDIGLNPLDRIDALITDPISNSDGKIEAVFSLTRNSPSLHGLDGLPGWANFDDDGNGLIDDLGEVGLGDDDSPADLFYTNFGGTFRIARTGDVSFGAPGLNQFIDFRAENLGLLSTDNIDAIDLALTGTWMQMPDGIGPVDQPVFIPEPSSVSMSLVGLLVCGLCAIARRSQVTRSFLSRI
ncbi:MAG: hypothetical protein ACK5WR_14085 [Planctomycetaceae bacterium]|jgi:hypothetical protein